jgi:hypothetical protein
MKSDLSKVKVGDKIWTIQDGWIEVIEIDNEEPYYVIDTGKENYTIDGKFRKGDKYPSAFNEYPFKEQVQVIEKDTLVWFRNGTDENWMVGYYSHIENEIHRCFIESKKSTETDLTDAWYIVTTENPLI